MADIWTCFLLHQNSCFWTFWKTLKKKSYIQIFIPLLTVVNGNKILYISFFPFFPSVTWSCYEAVKLGHKMSKMSRWNEQNKSFLNISTKFAWIYFVFGTYLPRCTIILRGRNIFRNLTDWAKYELRKSKRALTISSILYTSFNYPLYENH